MPTTTSACVSDDDAHFLSAVRAKASTLSFFPRGVSGSSSPEAYRSEAARDVACLLAFDPGVIAWACLPAVYFIDGSPWIPDFSVSRDIGTELIDTHAVSPDEQDRRRALASAAGFTYGVQTADMLPKTRLQNIKDLLRHSRYEASLGDRIRLLAFLEDVGSAPLKECLPLVRAGREPIFCIASLVVRRILTMEIDDALIGPDTRVSIYPA